MPSVTVITPWRNHTEFTIEWADAVAASGADEIIVVDDASEPPLPFDALFNRVRVVRLNGSPAGFCGACNAGLTHATSDAVVFLNNDIRLVRANWLREIRALLKPRTLVGECRGGIHTAVNGLEHGYVDGWCIGAWREDLLGLGGWDETLEEPAYYSDNLLTLRAQQAGWEIACLDIGLYHLVSGTAKDDPGRIHQAAQANRARWVQAVTDSKLVTT